MKNKYIAIFVSILAIIIVVVVVMENRSGRVDNRGANPFEYNYDEFKKVDPDLIGYTEFRQIPLNFDHPSALAVSEDLIYLIGDSQLSVINNQGEESLNLGLSEEATCVSANNEMLVIAYTQFFELRKLDGQLLHRSAILSDSTVITSLAIGHEKLYVADAGKRKVVIFNLEGKWIGEMGGISGSESLHGFIIPSANFDLALNGQQELWVVNPGMHALQHYSDRGDLINSWDKATLKIDGFSGCCNPANFTFLPNGHFITSEKGLVRIKEYDAKGKLISVVAAPEKFTEGGKSPDVAVDNHGIIYALDKDKKMLRMFKSKQN